MKALRAIVIALVCGVLLLAADVEAQKGKKKKKKATVDAGPALGTWNVVIQGRIAHLVFTERDEHATRGYFDMNPNGPMKAVAVVEAVVDPDTRVLRLTSREIHTNVPSIVPPLAEGTLSKDGKRIEQMRSLVAAAAPGVGMWQRPGTPPPALPSVAASLADTSERSLLYQQCSGDFLLNGLRIAHAPVRSLLEDLEESDSASIRVLAATRRAFQQLFDLATAKAATENRAAEANALRGELWLFVGKALNSDVTNFGDMRKAIAGVMDSAPIESIFNREKRDAHLACMREITVLAIQKHVRDDFAQRDLPPLAKADGLVVGVKVNGNDFGALTIRNDTGRDLHHCFIAPRLNIDKAKVDALEKEFRQKSAEAVALARAFGADLPGAAAEAEELVLLFNRLDKGSNNYLSEWKQGATVQIDLAQPEAIKKIGAAISLWVGADEGVAERQVDINTVAKQIVQQEPKEILTLEAHNISSKEIVFSPNGKWLASAGAVPQAIVWEAATGKERGKLFGIGTANAIAFHPSNALLAVGDDSGKVRLLNVDTMKEIGQVKHVPTDAIIGSSIHAVAFSKNGKILVSASADRTVKLWNLSNGQVIASLPHPGTVHSLALSRDGATLATGCADTLVRLWTFAKQETTATFTGHKTPVTALAFHPDGKTLASGSMDGLVKLWTIASGENPSDVLTNARNITLAFSADGKRLATGGDLRGVLIFDPASGETLATLRTASGPMAFGPGGLFATAWRDTAGILSKTKVKIWNLEE